jgi:glutamate-1-semialdehyde 2,1-aminomutase
MFWKGCFGKVVGGGLPVGAFGARKEIMSYLSPEGPVYQAGTLSGNPIAMAAGYTTLKILNDDDNIYDRLEKKTQYLRDKCDAVLKKYNLPFQINQFGSMMSIHFCEDEVVDFDSAAKGNNAHFSKVFHALMDQGVYLPPSPFESYFLNDALTYDDFDHTADALDNALGSLR